jgi:lactoylglutathione lyase
MRVDRRAVEPRRRNRRQTRVPKVPIAAPVRQRSHARRDGRFLSFFAFSTRERLMSKTVDIERVDHIGIRVRDLERALAFYRVLGFTLVRRATGDDVAIVRNPQGVEINLIFNADAGDPAENILMDIGSKYPGYTHVALRVASIPQTIAALAENRVAITQGPVQMGQPGSVSVFVRDPDRNVIELRGRDQGEIPGTTRYVP